MTFTFTPATKKNSRLRMALIGASGSGKSYSALKLGVELGGKVAAIDTERGSLAKYSDLFKFDVLELETYGPQVYVDAIESAAAAGYDVLIIDSLSHAWNSKGGALEQMENAKTRQRSGNSFAAWREVTPIHNAMVDAILNAPLHIIATMRAKTEYVQEKDDRGKTTIRKIGLAPIQRDGLEYEFDVVGDMDQDNNLIISKTRCPALTGQVFKEPGAEVASLLSEWLRGTPEAEAPHPSTVDSDADYQELHDKYGRLKEIAEKQGILSKGKPWPSLPGKAKPEVVQKGIERIQAAIDAVADGVVPTAEVPQSETSQVEPERQAPTPLARLMETCLERGWCIGNGGHVSLPIMQGALHDAGITEAVSEENYRACVAAIETACVEAAEVTA